MSTQDDGGPAFPGPCLEYIVTKATGPGGGWDIECIDDESPTGLTMRDWFAGQALAACVAKRIARGDDDCLSGSEGTVFRMATDAYTIADAMLAARKERAR